jgi:hypothetical protein
VLEAPCLLISTHERSYDRLVVYDAELAERIRELLAGEADVSEQRMFGGIAFLLGGNMAVAASGQGGLLVRVDPASTDEWSRRRLRDPWRCEAERCAAGCASTATTCGRGVNW